MKIVHLEATWNTEFVKFSKVRRFENKAHTRHQFFISHGNLTTMIFTSPFSFLYI